MGDGIATYVLIQTTVSAITTDGASPGAAQADGED